MWSQINKMGKGDVTTVHDGISTTTTSNAVITQGFNAILVKCDFSGSGSWTIKVQGALQSSGIYADLYDNSGSLMSTGSISSDRCQLFVGIPDQIKILATEDSGTATVTIKVQPIVV